MEKILVLDFGGQYNQLIARRIREHHVYAEVRPYNKVTLTDIQGYAGIIFTGGPNSVYKETSPHFDPAILTAGIPILGICYGHQLMAWMGGGEICSAGDISEYGNIELTAEGGPLFADIGAHSVCWMSHTDYVKKVPVGFRVIAHTDNCPCAAMCDESRKLYGVQFHPEVTHTECGKQLLGNFLFGVCGCRGDWTMDSFIDFQIAKIREQVGDRKVLLGLSGGVDSSVVGVLLQKAIGDQLTCIFVDHGLLRKGEGDAVMEALSGKFGLNIIRVDAKERFFTKLQGVSDPEQKRKIIGNEFVYVFDDEASKLEGVDFLAQGTLYTDIIESGTKTAQTIKSHHNVGGLPEDMEFELIEPLSTLFKDEVRSLGTTLGMPDSIVWRQPFPGPGLGIRVLGEITDEKVEIVRESDAILREEIANHGLEREVWQYFTVLPGIRSVGVMGDGRTYDYTIGIRAVTSIDGMTGEFARIDWDILQKISTRIVNEVAHVNRVVYDITGKPPATIEWE